MSAVKRNVRVWSHQAHTHTHTHTHIKTYCGAFDVGSVSQKDLRSVLIAYSGGHKQWCLCACASKCVCARMYVSVCVYISKKCAHVYVCVFVCVIVCVETETCACCVDESADICVDVSETELTIVELIKRSNE